MGGEIRGRRGVGMTRGGEGVGGMSRGSRGGEGEEGEGY